MADYTRQISASTTLLIRDTGGNVEFWIRTGPQSWNNDQQWSFYANGADSGVRKFRLVAGGNWQMMGAVYVGYNQDVRFSVYGSGIGFPSYDFYQAIGRSTVPQNPAIIDVHAVSSTHIYVQFVGQYDGGSPVLEWEIGYGGNPNGPEIGWSSNGISTIGPFSSGQRVYFWARGRNAIGWSQWSNRGEATTWRVPDVPYAVTFESITQISVSARFFDAYDGGTPVLERELRYSLDPEFTWTTISAASGLNPLTGLSPGKTYFFQVRSRNSVGWGDWTSSSQVTLIAGGRVFTGGQWKRAVPYVKVGGVWKVVRPWIRDAGVWKETSL